MGDRIRIGDCVYVDASVAAERDRLDQQVKALLAAVEDVRKGGLDPGHPQSARSRMFAVADQVRKERGA